MFCLVGGHWSGTATDLLSQLNEHAGYERTDDRPAKRRPKGWPGGPHILSGHLRTLTTDLRAVGLDIDFNRDKTRHRGKQIFIEKVAPDPAPGLLPDAPGGEENAIQDARTASTACVVTLRLWKKRSRRRAVTASRAPARAFTVSGDEVDPTPFDAMVTLVA